MRRFGIFALQVIVSFGVALLVTRCGSSYTYFRTSSGFVEATPVTEVFVFTVFPLTLVVALTVSNKLVRHLYRPRPKTSSH
jgi:hypothetical protein